MGKNGFTAKPRAKAVNPIIKSKYRSDELARQDFADNSKRTKKYGPRGNMRPIAGTNESFK